MPAQKAPQKTEKVLDVLQDHFDRCTLIEASAGTGKTWTLTALYARLLLERQLRVENILVVTYTKAATAELRDRIRGRLADLLAVCQGEILEDDFCHRLKEQYVGEDTAKKNQILLAVHGFDEAAVFTIHSFCQRALQDSAFEAGVDFDNVLTPDDTELVSAVLMDAWRTELAQASPLWAEYLTSKKVTPKWLQQRLKAHLGKPYLNVLPSAHSDSDAETTLSKLKSVKAHAAACWQDSASGDRWVAFLEEQAQSGALKKTTHSEKILAAAKQELMAYFSADKFLNLSGDKWKKLTPSGLMDGLKKGQELSIKDPQLERLAEALERLKELLELVAIANATRLAQLQSRLLSKLNQQLPERKKLQRVLSYDDLLNQLNDALKGPQGTRLAAALRKKYPVALIDEFQDTDPIQYEIFKRIYIDPATEQGEGFNTSVCFVGDPKQAIYAFRGADLDTYLAAKTQDQQQFSLNTNYRSTPALLRALNHLFQRPRPFSFPETALAYHPVEAPKKDRASLLLPPEEGEAALSWVWLGSDEQEPLSKAQAEALAVRDTATRIARILRASEQGKAGFKAAEEHPLEPLKGGDIAVLVASHRQASAVANALQALGVPCVRKGREGVWHSEESDELAAVLSAYADPSQEGSLRYALATRLLGYNAADLTRSQSQQELWDKEREKADKYHRLWLENGFLWVFRHWLDEEKVAARLLAHADGERRLTNLLHLGELLEKQQEQRPGMEPLLRWFSEQRSQEHVADDALLRLESDAERVQIVTIHTSKGLEYPLVFCPFLWDGRLLGKQEDIIRCHESATQQPLLDFGSPNFHFNLELGRKETFAEQLRLVYVALTRPKERLWVHWGPLKYKTEKGSLLAGDGLHTSALAWLIHGRDQIPQNDTSVLSDLGAHLTSLDEQGLLSELQALIEAVAPDMGLTHAEQTSHVLEPVSQRVKPHELSHLKRPLYSAWRIGSFSGLMAGRHDEAPDHDARVSPSSADPGEGIHAFPRGARAGTCLHAILEDWARAKASLPELTEAALSAYGFAVESAPLLTEHLGWVLNHPLDGKALSLAALPAEHRLPELGFTFPVKHLAIEALKSILTNPAMGLPEPLRQAAQGLSFKDLKGYLKGFIDLTFVYEGQWYILDYKSNWLGPDASHYQLQHLEQALAAEHYYLQYLIYLVALRRFLRQRFPDNPPQVGGAYYLFLRGMPEAGVYFDCPSEALLDALDQLFGQGDA